LSLVVGAAPSIKVSPASLSFTFQEGSATLPAAQTLAISPASGSVPVSVTVASGGNQWLTFTPSSGKTNLSVKVSVNPTSLAIGQYAETITLSTPETGGDPLVIPVTLVVKAPPADIRATPTALTFTHRLGDAPPSSQTVNLTTTGGLLSFSAASAAKWARATPTSGAIFPGFRTAVAVTVDVTDMIPGTQKGTLTISAPDAVTKTTTITVNLTVQPGQPALTSIWPPRIIRGAADTNVTLNGLRFFAGSVVKAGATTLKSTLLGPNSMTAVIPASLLAVPAALPITVTNPDPGGGTSATVNFDVLPPGPLLLAVVNAASQKPGALAPGMLFTIYGDGLGPDTLTAFDGLTPTVPTTMGGTRVLLNGTPLPVIYSSAKQVSAAAPYSLLPDQSFLLQVEYGGGTSVGFPVMSAGLNPALFTLNGTGAGNAAAFQVDSVKQEVVLNSEKTPATKAAVLMLYATGAGPTIPIPADGFVAVEASTLSIPEVAVLLGDTALEVLYAGAAPGLISGIVQINARIPEGVPTGKAVPLTLRIGTVSSPAGVTLNVK
jgi:uncharacterized protein (TIGR03437 family)